MRELKGLTKDGKKRSRKTKTGTKTKVCSYCGQRRDREKFATGRMCKLCKTKYDKERYLEKKVDIDFRMREYGSTEQGRKVNRRASTKYGKTRNRIVSQIHWYERLKEDPEAYAEFLRKHRTNNAVHNALKRGTLMKGVCEVCGDPNVHAHHDDYDKPLEVRWLCPLHHGVTRRLEAI